MRHLLQQEAGNQLPAAWCNSSATMTSLMEAVSFVTPLLENFFISTVASTLQEQVDYPLAQRCREFMHQEANHSRLHNRFNASVLEHLGKTPAALRWVQQLLTGSRKHLPLTAQLLLVAVLEHITGIMSKAYLASEPQWQFHSAFAQQLFGWHAREELAHRALAFDLCLSKVAFGGFARALAMLGVLFVGSLYLLTAVPWILYRKTGRSLCRTLVLLSRFIASDGARLHCPSILRQLFMFARRTYHPDQLVDGGRTDESK